MRKPRFFVGIREIGNTTLMLSRGLREQGYKVTNLIIKPSKKIIPQIGHDRYIEISNRFSYRLDLIKEFLRIVRPHDIFVFNYSSSFFTAFLPLKYTRSLGYMDLSLLKTIGKKVVVFSNGSDLRSHRLLVEELREAGLHSHAAYIEQDLRNLFSEQVDTLKKIKAQTIEKYADHIFAKPDRAQYLTKPFHLIWPGIDVDTMEYRIDQSDIPLIVHAPSSNPVKGTTYVLHAVNELKQDYDFRFLLCKNMPNELVRRKLAESEIVVDQLLLPGHGLLGVEAMSSGNAVLGSAVPGYNGFPESLPIVTTTPDTIYENLKTVLEDPKLRKDLAQKGRAYVEQYHDYKKVTADFLEKIGEQVP